MGMCSKCSGLTLLILGLAVLVYNMTMNGEFFAHDWATFIGSVFILKGFFMIVKPNCPCSESAPAKAAPKRRRRK